MICVQEEIIDIKCCGPIETVGFIYGNTLLSISISGILNGWIIISSFMCHKSPGFSPAGRILMFVSYSPGTKGHQSVV